MNEIEVKIAEKLREAAAAYVRGEYDTYERILDRMDIPMDFAEGTEVQRELFDLLLSLREIKLQPTEEMSKESASYVYLRTKVLLQQ